LKALQKDIKFQGVSSHCRDVGNGMADYLVKRGMSISQTSAYRLLFHPEKLRIKGNIQDDLSRYYATESQ
jgi:hypothetical protein